MSKERARLVRLVAIAASVAWSAVLYLNGIDLAASSRRLLAYLPTLAVLVLVAFDLWVWKWPGVHRLVGRPRIDGTWRTVIRPHAKSQIPKGGNKGPIDGVIVIEQTYWTLSVRLLTEQGSSMSEVATVRNHGESREQRLLTYTYRNEPKQEHRPRSGVHRGASEMLVVGRLPKSMSGTYWTDRLTAGDIDFTFVDRSTQRSSLGNLPA